MNNLPEWVGKVTTSWAAIGTLLIVLGSQGVNLPDFLPEIFSQAFVDATMQVIGAVITFFQFVRTIFAAKDPIDGQVQVLSSGQKTKFALNPFKLRV